MKVLAGLQTGYGEGWSVCSRKYGQGNYQGISGDQETFNGIQQEGSESMDRQKLSDDRQGKFL